jgi:hypothetical protein
MVSLTFDRENGFKKLWDTPMIPEELSGQGKWSGAAIWGGQPSTDRETFDRIYIATGNTYAVPKEFEQCMNSTSINSTDCLPKSVWQDSVLALDVHTGNAVWVKQLGPLDAWTVACGLPGSSKPNSPNCPQIPGPDADFGMAPAYADGYLSEVPQDPYGNDILAVGQKNGNLYTINPKTGNITWSKLVGPGGVAGGLSWGIAVDRKNIYYTAINSGSTSWQIQPSGQTTNSSAWGAIRLEDGDIIWETIASGGGQSSVLIHVSFLSQSLKCLP